MKNDAVKQLVKQNNELRKLLTPDNKKYYEKILLYMRSFGLFYDKLEAEQHLITILQDILEAQKHGESAEEYFGKNPKEMVDQLTKQFDKPSWKSMLKLSGMIFLISNFFSILSGFITPSFQVNIYALLLNGIISIVLIYSFFKLLHLSVYVKKQWPKLIKYFVIWILAMIPLGVFSFVHYFAPEQGNINIMSPFDWIFILVILMMSIFYVILKKKQALYGVLTFVISLGIFGLLLRVPQTKGFFQFDQNLIFIILGLFVAIALFLFIEWLRLRKMEDEN